jgi:hypothetical protein
MIDLCYRNNSKQEILSTVTIPRRNEDNNYNVCISTIPTVFFVKTECVLLNKI